MEGRSKRRLCRYDRVVPRASTLHIEFANRCTIGNWSNDFVFIFLGRGGQCTSMGQCDHHCCKSVDHTHLLGRSRHRSKALRYIRHFNYPLRHLVVVSRKRRRSPHSFIKKQEHDRRMSIQFLHSDQFNIRGKLRPLAIFPPIDYYNSFFH